MSTRNRLILFAVVFVLLYAAVHLVTGFERWFIDGLTVPTAAWAINTLGLSAETAVASGSRLVVPGGGLNVLQGCEGLDVLGLWLAATAASPLTARGKWLAWTVGTAIVFTLNQVRLLSLFHLYRAHRQWFGEAHSLWWPLALVALVWALFALWQRGFGLRPDTPPHGQVPA
ncbi:MAG: exosortase/archaeosortase family protein [Rhizobacter sp.]